MASRSSIPARKEVNAFFFFYFFDTFADRLKSAMENQNMTPVVLSALAGVSLITVMRWLKGTYEPRHTNLCKVARALNVSADYLCGIEG